MDAARHSGQRDEPQSVPGIDLKKFVAWIAANHPELETPLQASLLTGGHSNLTIKLSAASVDYVLRRPPHGILLESANDMGREYRVQAALQSTVVPVPQMLALQLEADPATGVEVPFYLMSMVSGQALLEAKDNAGVASDTLDKAMRSLARSLAELHRVDPAEVGLSEFGRPTGYPARQLARWNRQLEALPPRELPQLRALRLRLAPAPPTQTPAILHGDYKANNALFNLEGSRSGSVAAVLDWEMATLGEATTDLAVFGLYWVMPFLSPIIAAGFSSPVDHAAGYPHFSELLQEYQSVRPIDGDLVWHTAFACYKIGIITEMLHQRWLAGTTVGEGFDKTGPQVEVLAHIGHDVLDGRNIFQEA